MQAEPPPLPSPQRIVEYVNGHWAAITLSTAVRSGIFDHLDSDARTAADLAAAAGLSPRGTQALLDGLVGLGLLTVADGRYANTPEASLYLVEGKPAYMGAWARRVLGADGDLARWVRLPEVVKRGVPEPDAPVADDSFWDALVLALIPGAWPVAQQVATRLDFAGLGEARLLDVGGGGGVYSAVILGANSRARATQVDRANVNRIARDYVGRFGVGDRFETIDGDFREVDFGEGRYDVAIYSHIAHGESPADNRGVFRRLHRALKPGGTLVVVDFLVADDRSGPPFPLLFHLMMLLVTQQGATWRVADYRSWLAEAGFGHVTIEPTMTPASTIFARREVAGERGMR